MFIPCLVSKRHYYWHHSVFCDMKLENIFYCELCIYPKSIVRAVWDKPLQYDGYYKKREVFRIIEG